MRLFGYPAKIATAALAMVGLVSMAFLFESLEFWAALCLFLLVAGALWAWARYFQRFSYYNARELKLWLNIAGDLRQTLPIVTEENVAAPLLSVGPGFEQALGYTPQEMIGRPWTDFVHPDDLEVEKGGADRLIAKGVLRSYCNRWRHKEPLPNGDTRWVWLEWNAVTDHKLGKTYACGRDMSLRFQQESNMAMWSRITMDLMAITDAEEAPLRKRRLVWVNEAWPRRLGMSVGEIYNSSLGDLIHPEDLQHLENNSNPADDSPRTFECRLKCKRENCTEGYRTFEWSCIGMNAQIYLTGRDLGPQKLHRKEMARAIQDLKARNKDLERFASVTAHQLRSPPRTIAGIALALKEDYGQRLDDEGLLFLDDIISDANQMADIVDGLYRFSKVRTSEDMELEPVDLNEVIASVKESRLKEQCEQCLLCSGKRGQCKECPDRETCTRKCNKREQLTWETLPIVLGDKMLLREALANLVSNGFKFNKAELKTVTITQEGQDKGRCLIRVTDNGVGIDPKYQGKLFTMFERVHPDYPGTGVGLALVAAIINKFGGTVSVVSEVGKGATFSFDLKCAWTTPAPETSDLP